jgi:hypothetical protein
VVAARFEVALIGVISAKPRQGWLALVEDDSPHAQLSSGSWIRASPQRIVQIQHRLSPVLKWRPPAPEQGWREIKDVIDQQARRAKSQPHFFGGQT